MITQCLHIQFTALTTDDGRNDEVELMRLWREAEFQDPNSLDTCIAHFMLSS